MPFNLEPDTKLIVTVLPEHADEEREEWMLLSKKGLEKAYGTDQLKRIIQNAVEAESKEGKVRVVGKKDLIWSKPFQERELETGLIRHLEKFLLELGRGFAFIGRQYHLEVSDKDFYIDLLFYHLSLRCFVVIDLKKGDFKPEYAGKMNFYCNAVDDQLRHKDDQPTIGLILCQTRDRILAEYTLRDIKKPIGISEYELTRALPENLKSSLPTIEEIEAELSREIDQNTGKI